MRGLLVEGFPLVWLLESWLLSSPVPAMGVRHAWLGLRIRWRWPRHFVVVIIMLKVRA